MRYLKLSILFILPIVLLNCSSPGIKYVGKKEWADKLAQSTINTGELSYIVEQFLIINALKDKFEEDPEYVIKLLAEHLENPNRYIIPDNGNPRYTLFSIMELCMYQAMHTKKNDAMKYWVSCNFYAYKYLFDEEITPPVNKYYNMLGILLAFRYYNNSLAEVAKYLINKENLWESPIIFDTIIGKIKLEKVNSDLLWSPKLFKDFIVSFDYLPTNFISHSFSPGIGVPVIGTKDESTSFKKDEELTLLNLSYPFTFVLEYNNLSFSNGMVEGKSILRDCFNDEYVDISGHKVPLSKDYSVAIGNALTKKQYIKGLKYLFSPSQMGNLQELYLVSPYDPNKIPVVLVHGLMSEPRTWGVILNTILSNRIIRENYQFWFYSYPTGLPLMMNEYSFRKDLLEVKEKYDKDNKNPKFKQMVIVGHSMGGLLTRLTIQSSNGDYLIRNYLELEDGKSIKDTNLTKKQQDFVKSILEFEPLPFVKAVILIAAPNEGADMASYFFTRIASAMIALPFSLTHEAVSIAKNIRNDEKTKERQLRMANLPTGLDGLEPSSMFNKFTRNLPYNKKAVIYNIVGDIDKAGKKGGSDGVVPYSSAYVKEAHSELVLHGDHNKLMRIPETAKEITRILIERLNDYNKMKQ